MPETDNPELTLKDVAAAIGCGFATSYCPEVDDE